MPEQQLVEIAKALDREASVVIMDEPTASLGDQDAEKLFRIVADLKARGTGVIYVSHRFEELFRLADRVTVLRDGETMGTFAMSDMTTDELIRLMVGRPVDTVFPSRHGSPGEPVLEAKHVSCTRRGVHDASLVLRRGEVVGLAGLGARAERSSRKLCSVCRKRMEEASRCGVSPLLSGRRSRPSRSVSPTYLKIAAVTAS